LNDARKFRDFRRFVSVLTIIAFLRMTAFAFAAGTNLSRADAYYARSNYKKAVEFYKNAIDEYKTRLGKPFSSLAAAGTDAAKLAESEYKAALSMKKTGAAANQSVWVDATTRQVWVDATTKQVYVPASSKEIWVEPYYRQDGTYVKGYYRTQQVDAHYETQAVPGHYENKTVPGHYENQTVAAHYEKKWKDAYYKTEIVPAHNENVTLPEHYETKDVYKEKTVYIPVKSPYVAKARANLPAARRAPEDVASQHAIVMPARDQIQSLLDQKPGSDQKSVEAYNAMKNAYQSYMTAGFPTAGPEFESFKTAVENFKKSKQ